ncbi:hypothetical protein BA746_00365 [Vibrio parahaemolyticus]|uniref:hypothetical protein n=1 Tax=Vibrio parahaemolyticus TaxID=670 RepID=UPI0006A58BC0|nr:hypothetical protein [Vibrio parahaemolyticus]KOF30955.1 hypothetical protein ACX04_15970 [Vibrio parahaemolyticus]OTW07822.1 hypothetical protein BA743_16360 [Vibrio parahaemolyticus]OTW23943.1 hypothetical protein BA744_01015 [Vibrio parahaemolyticus]OTW27247.1 hypothetical protein BA746_00365 [Vibrio parahaemolyticus]
MENWDLNIINEYRALNYLTPFTDDAQAYRDGLLLQFTYNQNLTKQKDMKLATDFLPYLKREPDWLEHELVKKAKQFISLSNTDEMLANTLEKILEQVEIEREKPEPDKYLIAKLLELYNKHSKVA